MITPGELPRSLTRVTDEVYVADYLTRFSDESDLLDCLRGSCTVPLACGPPLRVRDGLYVDGALTESVPIRAALSGLPDSRSVTHILALLTRPCGELRRPPNLAERLVLFPVMEMQKPGLGRAHAPMANAYREEIELLARTPNTLVVTRPSSGVRVGRLEQNARVIARGAIEGAVAVYESLTDSVPRFYTPVRPLYDTPR